jgi:hypothetical protein
MILRVLPFIPCYRRQKNKLFGGISGRVFERSELLPTPPHSLFFWKSGDKGALFFGSVSFGHAKEMNAQRQRVTINVKSKTLPDRCE